MQLRSIHFLLIVMLVSLQQPSEAQFSLGANVGLNRAKLSGDVASGQSHFQTDLGFVAALRLDYRFSEAISLSFQPGFTSLRSRYQVMNDSGTALVDSTRLTLNAFSLPLHALVWSENGRFYALAGIQFDYTLGLKSEVVESAHSIYTYPAQDVKDFNLYMQFGAGFIVPLGNPYLSFELKYTQGLLDLTSELVTQDSYLPRTRLTHLSLLVGLQIPLGAYSEKYQVTKKAR